MRSIVIDANAFVSFFIERNEAQSATANRCDAVATFDRKLANRLESFGLAAYF